MTSNTGSISLPFWQSLLPFLLAKLCFVVLIAVNKRKIKKFVENVKIDGGLNLGLKQRSTLVV